MNKTGFNKHDIARNACQLYGLQAHQGYDWWWHSFTGYDAETGEAKPLGIPTRMHAELFFFDFGVTKSAFLRITAKVH